jgi:tRNA U34 5-methylaminomethyl-2-thiouridine-forming methyltransferase MnmC
MTERVLTDDGSWTLESARYGETYRSRRGAVREALHVFVEGSGVAARLAGAQATRVLEIGLGTCLNLALSAGVALRHGTPLVYVAVEHDPLPAATLADLGLESVADAPFVAALLAWRATWDDAPGVDPPPLHHACVRVEVIRGDATTARLPTGVDALYLDGFSPRVNPELWTPAALGRFARCLRPGGVLTTYSVSGRVRRGLAESGLVVARRAGPPGGKRESLRAERPAPEPGASGPKPGPRPAAARDPSA